MILTGILIIAVYLHPSTPDALLLIGVGFILFGTLRAYMRDNTEVRNG